MNETHLTDREREVLQLIAAAKPNKIIAYDLGISVKTVEKHRGNLCKKLNIHDSVTMTHYALYYGYATNIFEKDVVSSCEKLA